MKQKRQKNEVEEIFNTFVEDFGGELISKLFSDNSKKPDNADYFFRNRTIIAELKCLEKDYFNNKEIGKKLETKLNRWIHAGILRKESIKDGVIQTDNLSPYYASEIFQIFLKPMKSAIEKANKQIKETKKYFNLPEAKGLLILANDGNYSLTPKLSMHALANLLLTKHSGIDSFIYFTPNIQVTDPNLGRQAHLWISGRSRPSANAVESGYLSKISNEWIRFLENLLCEQISKIAVENDSIVENLRFIKQK